MNLWLQVTSDKYELPLAVADSAEQLASLIGVKTNNIFSAISNAKRGGYRCQYVKVELEEEITSWR